jgi:intracellular sulfur oxidation DsrE/DsrF family protein
MLRVLVLLGALITAGVSAQEATVQQPQYLAAIELHTAEELRQVLQRAEELLSDGALMIDDPVPVTFVLHGPEVRILLRQNYLANKPTVDLAASLSALGVVEIKACETWMGGNRIEVEELQPFVGTVPYGPAEARRLLQEENYLYF